jgi:FkbM family methyltransferase
MKLPNPILKTLRKTISFLLRFLSTGKLSDFLLWPVSKRLFGNGYAEIVNIDSNLKMRVYGDMNDMVNKSILFMSGYKHLPWEPVTARLVKYLSPLVKISVVAGSHIGYYPLIISANNPNSLTYAFEPNPTNYKRFLDNISINKFFNIKASPMALGDKEGEATMYFDSGQSSFFESSREHLGKGNVKITTLDNFIVSHSTKIDLMVLDAEGYEPRILEGAKQIVDKSMPDIIFEVNPKTLKAGGTDQNELCSTLLKKGYSLFAIEDNYKHEANESALDDMPFVNVFATINKGRVNQYL